MSAASENNERRNKIHKTVDVKWLQMVYIIGEVLYYLRGGR